MVLGIEVAGRWSEEARQFVALLAKAKARQEGVVVATSCRASLEKEVVFTHCLLSGT